MTEPRTEAGAYVWEEIEASIENGGGLHVSVEDICRIEEQAVTLSDSALREALQVARGMALSGAASAHLDGAGIMQDPPHDGKFADCRAPWCVRNQDKLTAIDTALAPRPTPDDKPSLDAAWKAAEDALPEGWKGPWLSPAWGGGWHVSATNYRKPYDPTKTAEAEGRTPTAALHALAAALTKQPKP